MKMSWKRALILADKRSSTMPDYPDQISIDYGSRFGDERPKEKTLNEMCEAGLFMYVGMARVSYHITPKGRNELAKLKNVDVHTPA